MVLCIAAIHAKQIAGEDGRLVAASAGADFQIDVAPVVRIPRHQQCLQLRLGFAQRPAQLHGVFAGEFADGVVLVLRQGQRFLQLRAGLAVALVRRDDGLQLGELPGERGEALAIRHHAGVRQHGGKLFVTQRESAELGNNGRGKRHGAAFYAVGVVRRRGRRTLRKAAPQRF